jgi:hypothetical protein
MERTTPCSARVVACLVAACLATEGCRRTAGVGETVPSPPRELIQQSYGSGPAPAAQAGAAQAGAGRSAGTARPR